MSKCLPLQKRAQFVAVYEQGRAWADGLLVLKSRPNRTKLSRCGISVSKSVGGAVVRNRVKRRLREILRPVSIRPGWDIVLIARPSSARAEYVELRRAAERLLSRARLMKDSDEAVRAGAH